MKNVKVLIGACYKMDNKYRDEKDSLRKVDYATGDVKVFAGSCVKVTNPSW